MVQNTTSLISPLPWAPRKDTQTNGRLTPAPRSVAPVFVRGRRVAKALAKSTTRPVVAIASPSLHAAASTIRPFQKSTTRRFDDRDRATARALAGRRV
jgi:hypothetical protein